MIQPCRSACWPFLGHRPGRRGPPSGTPRATAISKEWQGVDRCADQDAEAGRPSIGMRVRMLQRDPNCRIRLLCGCRKTCCQHSYYPNDTHIPWDCFAWPGPSSAPHRPARRAPLPSVIALAGHPCDQRCKRDRMARKDCPYRQAILDKRTLASLKLHGFSN